MKNCTNARELIRKTLSILPQGARYCYIDKKYHCVSVDGEKTSFGVYCFSKVGAYYLPFVYKGEVIEINNDTK